VEWHFLRVIIKTDFHADWVNLVMRCVESATLSLIINREPKGFVRPSRGIRQGDPVSPYLFSYLLNDVVSNNLLHAYYICHNAPPISHLLFADDSIIFCSTCKDEAEMIKSILYSYDVALGQRVSFDKSNVIFEKGIPPDKKNDILLTLDIRRYYCMTNTSSYPPESEDQKTRRLCPLKIAYANPSPDG